MLTTDPEWNRLDALMLSAVLFIFLIPLVPLPTLNFVASFRSREQGSRYPRQPPRVAAEFEPLPGISLIK
jgi:hypothetical protein